MISDKHLAEFKKIFKEEYGKELSDEEARDQGERLVSFFEILYQQAEIEARRKKRLEKEPDGFFLDESEGPYQCGICGDSYRGDKIWWTLVGLRCEDCWINIKNGVIPSLKHLYENDGVWFCGWQLKSNYGVHAAAIKKLRREGLLNGRDLKRKDGSLYHTVYLVEENQEFLKKYPRIVH